MALRTFIIILMVLLVMFFSEAHADYTDGKILIKERYRITGGIYHDAVIGADMYTDLYKLDFGINAQYDFLFSDFYWEREFYATALLNEGNFAGGGGFRLRGGCELTRNLRMFIGTGLLFLVDGGDIENLAVSPLYGSLEIGIEYKNFVFGIDHASSPFHGGEDGDSGINLFYLGIKF